MRTILRVAAVLVVSLAAGCQAFPSKIGHPGSLNCSCNGTACQCTHCTGESCDCHCMATDAYPDSRVGTPDDR
jgi:hypothetical protein